MVDSTDGINIQVGSLLRRPRNLPPEAAEAVYRAGESLALGLDMALTAHGVKRTNLIAQRVNRVVFRESWAPPGGWVAWESLLLAREAGRRVPAPPEIDPDLATARVLIGRGELATRFPHLLGHAAAPWYYVPRDFDLPLWLAEPQPQSHTSAGLGRTLSVGSVPRLVAELEALEPFLSAQGRDPAAWFPAPLLEATALSLETGLVIEVASDE